MTSNSVTLTDWSNASLVETTALSAFAREDFSFICFRLSRCWVIKRTLPPAASKARPAGNPRRLYNLTREWLLRVWEVLCPIRTVLQISSRPWQRWSGSLRRHSGFQPGKREAQPRHSSTAINKPRLDPPPHAFRDPACKLKYNENSLSIKTADCHSPRRGFGKTGQTATYECQRDGQGSRSPSPRKEVANVLLLIQMTDVSNK